MKQAEQKMQYMEHAIAVTIILLVGLLGVSAWLASGDNLLMALIQTGIAWCF